MADSYGVTPADVAAELPGLFPVGFTQATKPTLAQVTAWISVADARAYLVAEDVTGVAPQLTDKAVAIAKDFVVQWTKSKVLAAVYAGNDPQALANILAPSFSAAKDALQVLIDLGSQLVGEGEASPRLAVSTSGPPVRDLVIDDLDLDGDRGPSGTSEVLDSFTRWHRRTRF